MIVIVLVFGEYRERLLLYRYLFRLSIYYIFRKYRIEVFRRPTLITAHKADVFSLALLIH